MLSAIMGQIARRDLARAVEIGLTVPQAGMELQSLFNIARSSTGQSLLSDNVLYQLNQLPRIADRLLASDHFQAEQAMTGLLESWSIADPDAALVWLLAQGSAVDPSHMASLAAGYAQGDIRLTAATADRLPPESRGAWITEVAAAYVQRDPDAAIDWLAR
jgi:hypothetical protein